MRIHIVVAMAGIFGTTALFACGDDPQVACEDYLDTALACVDEAYAGDDAAVETAKAAFNGACDNVNSEADYFNCLRDAYANGDCSTAEGYAAIATNLANCTP